MLFRFKLKVLGWRLEIQSAPFPSPASTSPPPQPSPPTTRPGRDVNTSMEDENSAPSVPSQSEKAVKKPRDYLALAAVVIRAWQFVSSAFVYISMVSLFLYIRHTRKWNAPLTYVQELGLVSIVYSTIVLTSVFAFRRWKKLPGWPVFAWGTFAGDLMMMGLAVANITMLGQAGLPQSCKGLVPPNQYDASPTKMTLQTQPSDFTNIMISRSGYADFCDLPRVVWGFCVAAIFTHTLSILLTVFQIQRNHKSSETLGRWVYPYPGHVEMLIPSHIANRCSAPRPFMRAAPPARPHPPSILRSLQPALPQQPRATALQSNSPSSSTLSSSTSLHSPETFYSTPSTSSNPTEYSTAASSRYTPSHYPSSSSHRSPVFSSSDPSAHGPGRLPVQDDPNKYANMPPMEIIPYNPRASQDSTSTNPELYLVTDGFRPEEPPEYTSRPPSLYNGSNCL